MSIGGISKFIHKTPWSFYGIIIALLIAAFPIYSYFVPAKPELQFEILTSTTVFDIREDIGTLDILFDGKSIKGEYALSLITLRIINNGRTDILKSFYDSVDPVGFIINHGELAESPTLSDASNSYLKEHLQLIEEDSNKVVFSDVILDANDYFILRVLLLHPENVEPDIIPIGKIAGLKEIKLNKIYQQDEEPSINSQIFQGSLEVHISRFIAYIFILIISLFILIFPGAALANLRDRMKRIKIVNEFKRLYSIKLKEKDEFIFRTYTVHADPGLSEMRSLIDSKEDLADIETKLSHKDPSKTNFHNIKIKIGKPKPHNYGQRRKLDIFRKLFENSFLYKEKERIKIDQHMNETLDSLIKYLHLKHEFRHSRTFNLKAEMDFGLVDPHTGRNPPRQ